MSSETTEIIESLSIDGPIGVAPAICLGIIFAVIFAALLWSQRRAIGQRWAGVFLALRIVALCLFLWMLLDPTWVTRRITTKPQSVAILVDTSESMDVNDPLVNARQLRWSLAAAESVSSENTEALTLCDKAAVCVRVALHRSQFARQAVSSHQSSNDLQTQFESIREVVDRTVGHLEALLDRVTDDSSDVSGKTHRILSLLQEDVANELQNLLNPLDPPSAPSAGELAETLLSVEDALGGVERRMKELAGKLEQVFVDGGFANTSGDVLSRKQHVAMALEEVQSLDDEQSGDTVNLRAFHFDQRVAAASLDDGWTPALQTVATVNENETSVETPDADLPLTNISAVLDHLGRTAAADSIRSAILITDGAHNASDATSPQEIAATLGDLPVHVVPIGHTTILRDALLHRVDAPTAVVEKDSILIDVIVTAFRCSGESANLVLRRNGEKINERSIEFTKERTDQRTPFRVPADEPGRQEFELSLEVLDDESNTTNNVANLTVNVVRDTVRILLTDRIARWEYRYLEQLFRRDESVTFEKLVFHPEVRATGWISEKGTLPQTVDGWSHYDVVILGDVEAKHLNSRAQESLDEFVRKRGGHLVVIAGQENMPSRYSQQAIMDLLPVVKGRKLEADSGLQISLTPFGKQHPALAISDTLADSELAWRQQFRLRPLYSLSDFSRPKPTAETLIAVKAPGAAVSIDAGHEGGVEHALFCWHQAGAGRVAYWSAPATYRLRYRRGDRLHHRFWGQLLRWLTAAERAVGTQTVRISTDSVRYEQGESVDVTVQLADEKGRPLRDQEIAVTAACGDETVTVDLTADDTVPGRYIGNFPTLSAGTYQLNPRGAVIEKLLPLTAEQKLAETRITIAGVNNLELTNTRCNVALLQQIAEVTGGQMVPPTAIGEILKLSHLAEEISERVEREPLWTRWSLLVIAFACLCTEWIVRKRLGLV